MLRLPKWVGDRTYLPVHLTAEPGLLASQKDGAYFQLQPGVQGDLEGEGGEKQSSEWKEVKLGGENTECFAEKFGLQPECSECLLAFSSMKVSTPILGFGRILPALLWVGHNLQQRECSQGSPRDLQPEEQVWGRRAKKPVGGITVLPG